MGEKVGEVLTFCNRLKKVVIDVLYISDICVCMCRGRVVELEGGSG